jgi:predicted Zn-dependent protease
LPDELQLLEWIAEKRAVMGDSTPLGALPAAQAALQEYRGYKKTEKPPKSEERAQLEAHYATLQTKVQQAAQAQVFGQCVVQTAVDYHIYHVWRMSE